jgi:ring-1,2-phenylacetyl-CoA epoxidase subunit PaaD
VISVTELGIVREVRYEDDALTVVVTPTYSGCPATEVIQASIRAALCEAGAGDVRIETRLSPAWTTDWLTPAAAQKLRAYGIAPPQPTAGAQPLRFVAPAPPCPRWAPSSGAAVEFGATACKALYRCNACREPFE